MAEEKIGGRLFRVGHVLASDAIKLQVRLMKVVGGGVDRLPMILAGMGPKGVADPAAKAQSDAAVVAALADIFSKADPDAVATLISDILAMSQLQTPSGAWENVHIDQDFTTQRKDIFKVVLFILKDVLGDFFSGALESGALKKAGF